jgi:FAD:protein FMN transferase
LLSTASFKAMGVMNTVVVGDTRALAAALSVAQAEIQAIDATCSRFSPDTELSWLNAQAGGDDMVVSPLLEAALVAAFQAAEMTGGLVDPTVGRAVEEAGYTVDFGGMAEDGPALKVEVASIPGWRCIDYDAGKHTVRLPAGVTLDLGASGKAWAADRAASAVTEQLGVAVAVECGGDVAVSGAHPQGGWPVRVGSDVDSADGEQVAVFAGGLATSGTGMRRWRRGDVELHHIIDPATGRPAASPWAMVTVAAATCLEANAAATAALIMGAPAVDWLSRLSLPARLVDRSGAVHRAGGWLS